MNEIRVKRMLLAALAMLVVWIFMEAVFEAIEFPIAMIVGAGVYEGPPLSGEQDRD